MRAWLRQKFHTCHLHDVGVISAPAINGEYPCGTARRFQLQSDFLDVDWCCVNDHLAFSRLYVHNGKLLPDNWRETILPQLRKIIVGKDS